MLCLLCLSVQVESFQENFFHCVNCDLVFKNPSDFPSRKAEKARYDLHENDIKDPGYQNFVKPILDHVFSHFDQGVSVLDFGSGPDSAVSYLLKARGYSPEKYDPFFHPIGERLLRPYDVVIACEVVEHFHRPAQDWERLATLTKSELLVMTNLRDEKVEMKDWSYSRDLTHVVFYSGKTAAWIQKRFSFQKVLMPNKNLLVFKK